MTWAVLRNTVALMPGYFFMKALPTPSAVCVSKCAVYQLTCPSFFAASTSAASAARARETAAGANAASADAAALALRNPLRFIILFLPRSSALPRLLRPDFPREHQSDRERHYPPSPHARQGGFIEPAPPPQPRMEIGSCDKTDKVRA